MNTTEVHEQVIALTQSLVRCQSVTPDDAGCLNILDAFLLPRGFQAQPCDRNGIRNTLYTFGDCTSTPTFALAGHVDVVPVGDESLWQHSPWSAQIDDSGVMWGRGTVDMKGALAAMAVAAAAVAAQLDPAQQSLALVVTSDEEGPARDGTKAIVDFIQQQGWKIDWCIVGEPSCNKVFGDTIRPGRRGSVTVHSTIAGKSGHVAYPDRADNACHRAAALAQALSTTTWDDGHESFPPTSCQVTKLLTDSGAENVVPGEAVLQANWRFNPASPVEKLQARFNELADAVAPQRQDTWTVNGQPFQAPEQGPLVAAAQQAVLAITGQKPQLDPGGGTSDGRFIAAVCPEIIEFGPINATIHQVDERVQTADLIATCEIYQHIMRALFMPHMNDRA